MPIRPPTPAEQPSPIHGLAAAIIYMAANRHLLMGLTNYLNDPQWPLLLDDLVMLTSQPGVVGLRTPWARRVASPIIQAHKILNGEGETREKALVALGIILRQCGDATVAASCVQWLKDTYHVG